MKGTENAIQGKYGGFRGISEVTSRRKIWSGFFVGDPRELDNSILARCSLPHFTFVKR